MRHGFRGTCAHELSMDCNRGQAWEQSCQVHGTNSTRNHPGGSMFCLGHVPSAWGPHAHYDPSDKPAAGM